MSIQGSDFPQNSPAPTPSRANYGFALYLASSTSFFLYCLWSVDMENFVLRRLGVTYLPQVYWAVALPVHFLVTLALLGFIVYPGLNLTCNRPPEYQRYFPQNPINDSPYSVPPLSNIPMDHVSKTLYL